jgi:hypothetical protein
MWIACPRFLNWIWKCNWGVQWNVYSFDVQDEMKWLVYPDLEKTDQFNKVCDLDHDNLFFTS